MDRRRFNISLAGTGVTLLGGCVAELKRPRGAPSVLYSAVGNTMTHYDVDMAAATLTRRGSIEIPGAIQYAWPHPSNRYLYAAGAGRSGDGGDNRNPEHRLCALRIGPDGALSWHGEPKVLRHRPIHTSVDASGMYALTCYNSPAVVTVHRINADGTLGEEIEQPAELDHGVFPHQIRPFPSNRTIAMVTRGTPATPERPAQRGAIKLYGFDDGRLSPLASLAAGEGPEHGYNPRHLDFHPSQPWAYVLLELQGQLHMHPIVGDRLLPEPSFVTPSTAGSPPVSRTQSAGAVHVHLRGHVVYASNRVSGGGADVNGGQNNIAVFAIDRSTGEPRAIQFVDPQGYHARTFTIDPSGRLLIVAATNDVLVRDGAEARAVPAGLTLFRIQPDGRLAFARKYVVDVAPGTQQMWVRSLTLS